MHESTPSQDKIDTTKVYDCSEGDVEVKAGAVQASADTLSWPAVDDIDRDESPQFGEHDALPMLDPTSLAAAELVRHLEKMEVGVASAFDLSLSRQFAAIEHCTLTLGQQCAADQNLLAQCDLLWEVAQVYALAQVALEWVSFLHDGYGIALKSDLDATMNPTYLYFVDGPRPTVPISLASVGTPLAQFIEEIQQVAASSHHSLRRLELIALQLRPALVRLQRGKLSNRQLIHLSPTFLQQSTD